MMHCCTTLTKVVERFEGKSSGVAAEDSLGSRVLKKWHWPPFTLAKCTSIQSHLLTIMAAFWPRSQEANVRQIKLTLKAASTLIHGLDLFFCLFVFEARVCTTAVNLIISGKNAEHSFTISCGVQGNRDAHAKRKNQVSILFFFFLNYN